jgi:2-keto-4-pentenoate hydratase/2-oxohepta-3-ene-1,7-dioic acid hydratase in catechol pathway
MKLCRFDDDRVGVVRDDQVFDVTEQSDPSTPIPTLPARLDLERWPRRALASVRLLSPVRAPGKIVAAPVNYRAHIEEMHRSNVSPGHDIPDIDRAGLFLKASSSLVGPSEGIAQRFLDRRTDYEVELVVVFGKEASEVSRAAALDYVAGYCVGLDITVRGTEDRSFRKSIDTYAVLGPWLTTVDEVPDPGRLQLTLHQNGELRQNTNTSDLIFGVPRLIEFATRFYTMRPGDVLFTGTPQGVGPIRPGDRLRAACEGVGAMEVDVREFRSSR